ncbi:NAD(P)H-binding protein [Catenuloplanes japonicus]|uniref:NAD(P)H-binding protein n=1 Tax=Catenuloplanes japonicus TaxID=33876 RepID=UPI000525F676|nr:NAD(P)H-binding protein [Catenuloplanes japonicus]
MIVVSGATGNVGRLLVRTLADAGAPVTAVSRHTPPDGGIPDGVTHHRADLDDPSSLSPALAGADAFFLLVPEADTRLVPEDLIRIVTHAGVRRIVLLSSVSVGSRPDATGRELLHRTEEAIEGSGLEWTHLRPGLFATHALHWAPSIRADRTVEAAFADVAHPVLDVRDLADVAATVLREPGHGGRVYVLTGPEPSTPRQRADTIGTLVGAPITVVALTAEQARERMPASMPAALVDNVLAFNGAPNAAEQAVSPDVATVLGRPPRPFAEWAARNIDAFN